MAAGGGWERGKICQKGGINHKAISEGKWLSLNSTTCAKQKAEKDKRWPLYLLKILFHLNILVGFLTIKYGNYAYLCWFEWWKNLAEVKHNILCIFLYAWKIYSKEFLLSVLHYKCLPAIWCRCPILLLVWSLLQGVQECPAVGDDLY